MSVAEAAPVAAQEPVSEVQESQEQEVVQSEGEVSQEGEAKSEAKEELKQEIKNQIKKFKIKVDGKELEKELDLANEAELVKMLQMSEMSNKRAQEAAELRKNSQKRESELNQFLDLLKNNPEVILKEMGRDPVKFAEELLQAEVEKMQMDPKEKRIKELEAEMKKIQDREIAEKKAKEEAQAKAVRDKYAADFEKDIMEAMNEGKLPNSGYTINKLVDYMSVAMKAGVDISFKEMIPLIQEQRRNELKPFLENMSADEIIALLSESKLNDIVIKKTPKKKVAPPTAQQVRDTSTPSKDESGAKLRSESAKDYFNKLMMQYAGQD